MGTPQSTQQEASTTPTPLTTSTRPKSEKGSRNSMNSTGKHLTRGSFLAQILFTHILSHPKNFREPSGLLFSISEHFRNYQSDLIDQVINTF